MADDVNPVHPISVRDGAWFTQWLADRRFTDAEIARRLDVTPQAIWNWKRSDKPLKATIVLALDAIDRADLEHRQSLNQPLNGG